MVQSRESFESVAPPFDAIVVIAGSIIAAFGVINLAGGMQGVTERAMDVIRGDGNLVEPAAFSVPIQGASLEDWIAYQPTFGQSFGPKTGNSRSYGYHGGIDFGCNVGACAGADVVAPIAGKVVEVTPIATSVNGNSYRIKIEGSDWKGPVKHRLVHVDNVAVAVGDQVEAGQIIAKVAPDDSKSEGAHLDWKIERNGSWFDPQAYLAEAKEVLQKKPKVAAKGLPVAFDIKNGDRSDEITAIIHGALNLGVTDAGQIAYILATAQHESAGFSTVQEIGDCYYFAYRAGGRGYIGILGNATKEDACRYSGKGLVQVTGKSNAQKLSGIYGEDYVSNPELLKAPDRAVTFLVEGMMSGIYTGRALPEFVKGNKRDFRNARKVVNGMDRAGHIAAIAKSYVPLVEATLRDYGITH